MLVVAVEVRPSLFSLPLCPGLGAFLVLWWLLSSEPQFSFTPFNLVHLRTSLLLEGGVVMVSGALEFSLPCRGGQGLPCLPEMPPGYLSHTGASS